MGKQIVYCLFFFALSSCSLYSLNNGKEIKGLKLSSSFPFGGVVNTTDSLLMYFQDELVVIRIPYETVEYNRKAMKNDSLVIISDDESTISSRKVNFFNFVYNVKSKRGLKYSTLSSDKISTFNIDSLLRNSTFKGIDFYDTKNERLIETINYGDTIIREKHINVFKPDASYTDTSYYYFDKTFDKINYSLSTKADDLKKMKLVKIRLIYKASANKGKIIETPRKEIIVEIKSLNIKNSDAISSYFNAFKKDKERFNLE